MSETNKHNIFFTDVHYCNVTFVREKSPLEGDGDGVDGFIKLKRCTRCRCTYYINREAQMAHWKVHKKVCKYPDDDPDLREIKRRIFESETMRLALDPLRLALIDQRSFGGNERAPESPRVGFAYLWTLQRWEQLAKQGVESSSGVRLIVDALLFLGQGMWTDQEVEQLWAVPGMATFILNLDLLPTKVKARKLENPDNHPHYKTLSLSPEDFPPGSHLCSIFLNQIGCVLCESALCRPPGYRLQPVSPKPVRTSLRHTAIARAASRKVMSMLLDRWTFASLPAAQHDKDPAVRDNLFANLLYKLMIAQMSDPDDPTMLVPGLTYEGAVRVLFHYIAAGFYSKPGRFSDLKVFSGFLVQGANTPAWNSFSVEHRADLAVEIDQEFVDKKGAQDLGLSKKIRSSCVIFMGIVTGWRGLDHPSLWMKVMKQSRAKHGHRAWHFQEWLELVIETARPSVKEYLRLANVSVPDEVETLICEFSFEGDTPGSHSDYLRTLLCRVE